MISFQNYSKYQSSYATKVPLLVDNDQIDFYNNFCTMYLHIPNGRNYTIALKTHFKTSSSDFPYNILKARKRR
jgi:hypothetical protein